MAKNQALTLLGGLTPSEFLAEYWQKKPLLIKKAIPDFTGLLSPDDLAGLSCEDEVQSRIAQIKGKKWVLRNGPFDDTDFSQLPHKDWTLLVQSVNHYLPEAADLLAQFDFIPHARLDDLMVSYAPDGGGIGAHVDSYDVFLLQGSGRRNWKVSNQKDLTLIEDAPLKILKNFESEQEWTLEAGDMLYLPPQIAHWGTAVGENCMTYSIGFRAPKVQELTHEFLSYLQDNLSIKSSLKNTDNLLYTDPDLQLQNHPAEISATMLNQVSDMLQKITWDKQHVADFLGKYLTEPKPVVFFEPARKLSKKQFLANLQQKTLRLDLKSQLLFTNNVFYLNGEKLPIENGLIETMQDFADNRYLSKTALTESLCILLADALFEYYLAGFIYLD
ncbi:cupin domain-containing protein [Methylotenera versatilis]|uniref:cupin domain-containing protein n=1 Tax=Methylotenera versatilis TaxID=1055487 RepID=UPI000645C0FE|nr:cupin domain-containing protein [Methylotenera versatilis]